MTTDSITRINDTHYKVHSEILINAPVAEVWAAITDWDAMPSWSTFGFQGLEGDVADGNIVTAHFLFGEDRNEIQHTLIYEEGVRYGWSDPTGPADMVPFGGFTDNHIFEVEAVSETQTRFIQTDEYTGPGNKAMNAQALAEASLPAFQAFNNELKTHIESGRQAVTT